MTCSLHHLLAVVVKFSDVIMGRIVRDYASQWLRNLSESKLPHMCDEPIIGDQWSSTPPNSGDERKLAIDDARERNIVTEIPRVEQQELYSSSPNNREPIRQLSFVRYSETDSEENYGHQENTPGICQRNLLRCDADDNDPDIRSGSSSSIIPRLIPEYCEPSSDLPRFVSLHNNHELTLEKCYVAPRLCAIRRKNYKTPRSFCDASNPSSLGMRQTPEDNSNDFLGAIHSYESFDALVNLVLSHPMLPLLFRGVFTAVNGRAPIIKNARSESFVRQTEEKAKCHEVLCKLYGVQSRQNHFEEIDLFFTASYAALKSLQSDEYLPITVPLFGIMCAFGNSSDTKRTNLISHFSLGADEIVSGSSPSNREQSRPAECLLENRRNENAQGSYSTRRVRLRLAREYKMTQEQVNNVIGNKRAYVKRKALKINLQTGKRNGCPKQAAGQGKSVLAPIVKWKNIVLANSRKSSEKNESLPTVISRLSHQGENGVDEKQDDI